MTEEEEREKLKRLFYENALTQYGKRKLIANYEEQIKKQQEQLEEKDKIIDLILQDMIDQKCYSSSRTILKRIYERKVEDN